MNFADLFRNSRRVRSRTFSGGMKAKEPQSRFLRSSSDSAYELPDVNPQENKTSPYDLEPTTRAQGRNGGGSKPRISASEQNLCAVDSATIQSDHGKIRIQASNGSSARQTEVSSSETTLCGVDVVADRRKQGGGFWNHSSGLSRKKSLSTSNIYIASTRKAQYPVKFDINTSAVLPFGQNDMQALFVTDPEVKVEAGKTGSEAGKTSPLRRVSLVKETELHTAIACDNDREVCSLLDEQNMDPNETCQNALTLLHRAAIEGSYRCLKILLSHGADVNARDFDGWTPLHDAVFHGHIRCALALLISGADVEAETFEFVKPIEMALEDDMVLIIGRAMTMYHDGLLSKPDRETLV